MIKKTKAFLAILIGKLWVFMDCVCIQIYIEKSIVAYSGYPSLLSPTPYTQNNIFKITNGLFIYRYLVNVQVVDINELCLD